MKVILDPEPRRAEEIFTPAALARLAAEFDLVQVAAEDRAAAYAAHLPDCVFLLGQQPMDAAALALAPKLRAIFNVETNFLPNIDYEACFARGVHVLAPSGVFALPVAEMGLAMALSLARGVHESHADFLAGRERYGLAANARAELLTGSDIGVIGYGDIGRRLAGLLAPFRARIRVFDPWLPAETVAADGHEPAGLDAVLERSRTVFVAAAVTTENRHLLDAAALARMQDGAMLLILSRAAVADFDALRAEAASGRLRIATDVFPDEPVAPADPLRATPNMLFSPHKAGALSSALTAIGDWVLADMGLIARGLPPQMCKRAERETIARLRSKPVEVT